MTGQSSARRASVWLAVFILATGCSNSIRFVSDTVVDQGGNVVRRTQLASSGSASFDAISTRYGLLPGGVWTESVEEPKPGEANAPAQRIYDRRYTLTRRFARGDEIPGDFRRLGRRGDRAASNMINVRARRYWFVDTYEYEETFRDIVTPEGIKAAVRGIYAEIVDQFAAEIAARADDVSPQIARDRLREHFDPMVEALLALLDVECFAESSTLTTEECFDSLEGNPAIEAVAELGSNETFVSELIALFPTPAGVSAAGWRSLLSGARIDVEDWLETLDDIERGEQLEDDIFGAHGFALFASYPFEAGRDRGTAGRRDAAAVDGAALSAVCRAATSCGSFPGIATGGRQ